MTTHYAYKKDGIMKAQSLRVAIDALPDGYYEFTLRKTIKRRSNPQNRYFHGVVLVVAVNAIKELGTNITPEQLKEWWKMQFAPVTVPTTMDGLHITLGKPTSEMDVDEFSDFVNECCAWCAEQGIIIPAAGEQQELNI